MDGVLARYVFISSIRDDMLSDCKWHFKVLIIRLKCLCLFDFTSLNNYVTWRGLLSGKLLYLMLAFFEHFSEVKA